MKNGLCVVILIQQLIPIKVLKAYFKQRICLTQIRVYMWGWDDSLCALSVCPVNKPNHEYDKLMSGQAQRS